MNPNPMIHAEAARVERHLAARQALASDRRTTRGAGMHQCDAVWFNTYRAAQLRAFRAQPPGTVIPAWAQANYEREWRRMADQARADCFAGVPSGDGSGLSGLGELTMDQMHIVLATGSFAAGALVMHLLHRFKVMR